jgi:digeranylgeranylglycerophospholipid reductase
MHDVVVIGAGIVGCRTAELIAKKGFNVALIEEHADVGAPVQCAGLVSHRLKSMLPDLPNNIFLNEVRRAKFFSPSSKSESDPALELESAKPVYVIDREKLDKALFKHARVAGVKAARSTKFTEFSIEENKIIISTNRGKIESKLLVGADGPSSLVAKRAKLDVPMNYLAGVQATVEGEFEPGAVELWFDNYITPDFFAWVVPMSSKQARIGLAAETKALEHFRKFVKRRTKKTIKPDVGGRINFGLMDNTTAERVMVVGDAACQVKPFSGGGVIYGLIGAGYCANACVKALRADDFSAGFLKQEYDEKWKWQLGKPIKRGLLYRKILLGSDKKMNLLLSAAGKFKFIMQDWDMDLL